MTKLIRMFNQNREVIIVIISFIAFITFGIHSLNKISVNLSNNTTQSNISNNIDNTTQEIADEESQNKEKIKLLMTDFVTYCNNKNYTQAYKLLTDDNKKYYENEENFYKRYIKNTFSEYLDFRMMMTQKDETTNTYTYKITYSTDSMATGSTTKKSKSVTYQFEKQEDESFKINIRN